MNGCSCHLFSPCSWCMSLTEEEVDIYATHGVGGVLRHRNGLGEDPPKLREIYHFVKGREYRSTICEKERRDLFNGDWHAINDHLFRLLAGDERIKQAEAMRRRASR